jgi:hypothetical protein
MRASATSSTDVLFADSVVCEKKERFLVTFCRLAKSYPLLGAEAFALKKSWIPASAGMTSYRQRRWIPAFAGMTIKSKRLGSSVRCKDEPAELMTTGLLYNVISF